MKKVVAILLVLSMAIALAACGGGTAATEAAAGTGPKAGTYTGEAKGYGGDLKVDVTIAEDGKITEVKAQENSETPEIGGAALETLAKSVVEKNGVEGVEAVSGATVTSEAFIKAVTAAVDQAK